MMADHCEPSRLAGTVQHVVHDVYSNLLMARDTCTEEAKASVEKGGCSLDADYFSR
jgi:hypothetical protein